MATPRATGGYIWREEVQRARVANRRAREFIRRLLDDRQIGPTVQAVYLAQIAIELGVIEEVISDIDKIGTEKRSAGRSATGAPGEGGTRSPDRIIARKGGL
jgi:hypothetical protein